MITKSEFADWRRTEIYQEMWKDVAKQVEGFTADIVNREGVDTPRDQLLKGVIKGLSAVLDWQPEFEPDPVEEENDEV